MKNVLQILNYAANYRGNFMESLSELDSQLHKKNVQCIYLFTISENEGMKISWIKEMKENGIPVEFLPKSGMKAMKFVREIAQNYEIGIIHTHFLTGKQFIITRLAVIGLQIQLVIHFHNHALETRNIFKKNARAFMYARCKLIGVSSSVTEGLRKIYPFSECFAVSNAISFSRLDSYAEEELFKREPEEIKCLIFGFDYKRKGVDLGLAAVKQLIDLGHRICLIISLSTNEEIVKQHIINEVGELPNWVICVKARNDVATLYRNVDVFLSPSREEGFCYSIVEAAYCGCRVVASKIPAQGDLQVPNVLWFESENVDELKNAIQFAIHDNTKVCVQELLKETYNLEHWAEKVIKVYESM